MIAAMSVHSTGLDFADPPERVIRTHANIVLLYADRALKLKKPVRFPFLDYSTLALRRKFIQAELDLNRRFSPQVYRGVCEVLEDGGNLKFGPLLQQLPEPSAAVVDYAVVMRRIPERDWLPNRLKAGVSEADIRGLMRLLAATWQAHPADAETRQAGMPASLRANTVANIGECERFVPLALSRQAWKRLDGLLRGWFEANHAVFEQRVSDDRIRDGHGDLKPSNIAFMDGKPVVTDCIEFNPQFRRMDTLAEAAFLATGLEQLGEFALGAAVLRVYREVAGDVFPDALRRYYQAHLACVMGKVSALQLDDTEIDAAQREEATAFARRCFALADFHAREPHVIVICGVIGSGKSTAAGSISQALGWPVISSDLERKAMLGVAPTQRLPEEAYSGEVSARVYQRLYDAVGEAGAGIILDAQFPAAEYRRIAAEAATQAGGQATIVFCDAPEDVLLERLTRREQEGNSISDAGKALLPEAMRRFDAPSHDEGVPILRFDATQPVDDLPRLLIDRLLHP